LYLLKSKLKDVNLRNAVLGRGVVISNGCGFFNGAEVFGNVEIGQYTSISGPATRICAEVNQVKIGSFCSIASSVVIQEFYHNYNRTTTYNIQSNVLKKEQSEGEKISKGNIIIEDDVWIGSNSIILSGVRIGRGAIIGAGSVVTKDVERYSVVAGNPSKVLRKRFSEETINILEKSEWWLWDAEKIREDKEFFTVDRI
jgi:virginiamycin A acetyltransferase